MLRRVFRHSQSRLVSGLFSQTASAVFGGLSQYRQFLTSTVTKNAIILAGPNIYGIDQKVKAACDASHIKTTLIGDGNKLLSPEDIHFSMMNHITRSTERTLLFILAHGRVGQYDETHKIGINPKNSKGIPTVIDTKEIFKMIKQIGKPVDVVSMSCHGGAACRDTFELPDTSTYLAFSNSEEKTPAGDIRTIFAEPAMLISPEHLLIRYLTNTDSVSSPCISYINKQSGSQTLFLHDELYKQCGKNFSDHEKAMIYDKLKPFTYKRSLDHSIFLIEDGSKKDHLKYIGHYYDYMLAATYFAKKAARSGNTILFFKSATSKTKNHKEETRENTPCIR